MQTRLAVQQVVHASVPKHPVRQDKASTDDQRIHPKVWRGHSKALLARGANNQLDGQRRQVAAESALQEAEIWLGSQLKAEDREIFFSRARACDPGFVAAATRTSVLLREWRGNTEDLYTEEATMFLAIPASTSPLYLNQCQGRCGRI